jgi:hypothetical protein
MVVGLLSRVLLLVVLLHPTWQRAPDLVVTIRDQYDAGVAQVVVSARDADSGQELAQAQTDAHGRASLAGIQTADVRVVVSGQLADGTSLFLEGMDANGIALFLGLPPTTLDLRVEPGGMVIPDPVSMIEPEQEVIAYPTAPIAVPIVPGEDGAALSVGTDAPASVEAAPAEAPIIIGAADPTEAPAASQSAQLAPVEAQAAPIQALDTGAEIPAAPASGLPIWLIVGLMGLIALVLLVMTLRRRTA